MDRFDLLSRVPIREKCFTTCPKGFQLRQDGINAEIEQLELLAINVGLFEGDPLQSVSYNTLKNEHDKRAMIVKRKKNALLRFAKAAMVSECAGTWDTGLITSIGDESLDLECGQHTEVAYLFLRPDCNETDSYEAVAICDTLVQSDVI